MTFSDSFTKIASDIDRNEGSVGAAWMIKLPAEPNIPEGKEISGVFVGPPDAAMILSNIMARCKETLDGMQQMSQGQKWR